MRIAIVGGTGTLGRLVVEEARVRGHQVRVLSRRSPEYPVDLRTGRGLADALDGVDVVVDAANDPSRRPGATLVEGTRLLLAAEVACRVRHHVAVSVVGAERLPGAYTRAKTEQELTVANSPVPWTIVRATQFHELLVAGFTALARTRLMPLPAVPLRPVAAAEVAPVVVEAAELTPRGARLAVVGPEVADLRRLAAAWREATGSRALPLTVPLPGAMGRALRAGAATGDDAADATGSADSTGSTGHEAPVVGVAAFAEWLRGVRV
ncbi:NAD(P)H-binding protein [Streptomyces sp. 3MP-14]|uniref:NAD(P)H-binding protein n=1 Tax=Streptomyces mimosae TaxID=2586635 RepID=A0A5N6AII1_9ACTN|nr:MULTISPECIES: NAD(P)H-binding protein [Streptomyces]KAB8167873.1 NAD(P)H-binding protein [Streptomyces mimosae]KAB8177479.1 NAD(P)H-binding protein [Streptomyces sp. 3MP-14]